MPEVIKREASIPSKAGALKGTLLIPKEAKGIVVFAHGSGSGRFSPRNQYVARFLNEGGLATLLLDLLTPDEEKIDEITRHLRFDISLLAERLDEALSYLEADSDTQHLAVGYFGSSTGAAAALIAAAKQKSKIKAVVSRGGRPDLAAEFLPKVMAPTLLIVGGWDEGVIELNQQAFNLINSQKKIEIVPGATHLFEEPGTLEQVAALARRWFLQHLTTRKSEDSSQDSGARSQ